MSKIDTLQREYDDLSERCGSFDQDTIKQRRDREEQNRQWAIQRKKDRQDLIAKKGQVFERLQAAKAEAKADQVAAEVLELTPASAETPAAQVETAPPVVETIPPAGETIPATGETIDASAEPPPETAPAPEATAPDSPSPEPQKQPEKQPDKQPGKGKNRR